MTAAKNDVFIVFFFFWGGGGGGREIDFWMEEKYLFGRGGVYWGDFSKLGGNEQVFGQWGGTPASREKTVYSI